MKINSMKTKEGVPYTEGYAEVKNPKTGQPIDDLMPAAIEAMPVNITVAPGVTHEGDMGRLGKSE